MINKEQIDIIFKKKILPESYDHCHYCVNYQTYLASLMDNDPRVAMVDVANLTPNCMWYVEHVLNGKELSSNTCPWYLDCRSQITVQ